MAPSLKAWCSLLPIKILPARGWVLLAPSPSRPLGFWAVPAPREELGAPVPSEMPAAGALGGPVTSSYPKAAFRGPEKSPVSHPLLRAAVWGAEGAPRLGKAEGTELLEAG